MAKHIQIKDEDERYELGSMITDDWRDDNIDRDVWLRDLPRWLDAYQGRPKTKNLPWKSASNLFVPVTATNIEAIHPKLMAALWKPDPVVALRPQEPSDDELTRKTETFLDYVVREECDLFPIMDRVILGTLINGIQVVKVTWDVATRSIRDKHVFEAAIDPITAIQRVLEGEKTFADAIEKISDEEYDVIMKGRKVKIEVESNEKEFTVFTEREEVTRQAPLVEIVNPEDINFPSNTPYDLQSASRITHRYWLTLPQVKANKRKGIFHYTEEELVELENISGEAGNPDDQTSGVKEAREQITGAQEVNREGGPEEIEILESYRRYDIDDDGIEEEVIITVPAEKPDILLRVVRLEDVYKHGMKPFVLFYMNPISNTVWCQGVPQMIEGLQEEINVIHNQRVDAGTINNTPWGYYNPSAGLRPDRTPLEPGVMIPVNDVNQIKMHQPSSFHAWGFQEESQLYTLLERRTKVSDITIGRIGEAQGAARTATGVQALNTQQATGFDILIRRIQEGWKKLLQQILALYKEYLGTRMVRITGDFGDPDYVVSKDDISHKMDMVFTGNSLSTDREVERNTTTFLAQTVMNPNVINYLMQLRGMTPQGAVEWFRHVLSVFDVPRLHRILTMPPMPQILSPEDVLNRLITGEKLMPKQGEDHDGVIMMITDFLNNPERRQLVSTEILQLIENQIPLRQSQKVNEQLQQMMMAMQATMMQNQGMGMVPGQGGAPVPLPMGGQGLAY